MSEIRIKHLSRQDGALARELFTLMSAVFEEDSEPLSAEYVDRLLDNEEFWAMAAFIDDDLVGGLTSHVLPLTRAEKSEIFVYDIAVKSETRRRGVGRRLVETLRDRATQRGIDAIFIPADAEDAPAVNFYRAIGGDPSSVTFFTF